MSTFAVEYWAKVCNVVFYLSVVGAVFFPVAAIIVAINHYIDKDLAYEYRLTLPENKSRLIRIFLGLAVVCLILLIFVPSGGTIRLLKG